MTTNDAILLERSIPEGIEEITMTGGLLSLYCGFSFLSLTEVVFWILRSILYALLGFFGLQDELDRLNDR